MLVLSALPVISNFIGATIAEALPLSKQTLGLALHAAPGVLLAILVPRGFANVSTELIPRVLIAKPAWATILSLFLGGAFFVWVNQMLNLDKNRLRGQGDLIELIVLAFTTGTLIPHSALQLLRHILVTKTRQFDDTTDRNSLIAVTQN